ncbi:thiamine phosphate synthase [Marinicauda salina]|uniref:Thiamine-phosphate synthase n=1 Tax=Marinicauda salina TaxID=2135793 RepID=A0A2U2BQN6_9PROT|nr:thiamine phosphate synthase [Marinicauda salina]PWE16324.1 thiamine phosphate synthase [Marinicauda salina]
MSRCELYLLTPPRIDAAFPDLLRRTLDAGRVAALQIRLKDHSEAEIASLAPELIASARERGVAAILNDRPDLAAKLDADGVHVGQEDASIAEARAAVGRDRIVGATCHDSRHLAMLAGEAGADYVAFGSFFPTATKTPKTSAPIEILEWWSELFEIPCVAIGGITTENAATVIQAGADYIAVSGGVWSHPDGPEAAVRAFSQLLS